MFQSILDDVKREFRYGNMVTRLIIVNAMVFVAVNIVIILLKIFASSTSVTGTDFIQFFSMPTDVVYLMTHPWTIVTAGFTHQEFGHILWNMLAFYWFGRIVGDLLGNHRVLPLYLLSVVFANIVFFTIANIFPMAGYALGASGAVMAMIACAAYVAPDYIFNVLLVGPIKLKYIALVLIFLDIIAISNNYNAGGSIAHLGGAAFGVLYASQLRKGIDLGKPITRLIDFISGLFNGQSKKTFNSQKGEKTYTSAKNEKTGFNTSTKGNTKSDTDGGSPQEKLDLILDKIKERGYESLTKEEKEFLFNASKK